MVTSPPGVTILEAIDIARRAVEAADDMQAGDIVLLDAQGTYSFTDYFVICTGESQRQLYAIYDEIEHSLKREEISPHHREGTVDSGWLLIDYGSVIVHIFATPEREYYQLDKLWAKLNPVLRIQ